MNKCLSRMLAAVIAIPALILAVVICAVANDQLPFLMMIAGVLGDTTPVEAMGIEGVALRCCLFPMILCVVIPLIALAFAAISGFFYLVISAPVQFLLRLGRRDEKGMQ